MPRPTRLWEYFQKNGKDEKAACNYCNKILSYRATTHNLKKHLRLVHPAAYLKLINSPPLKTAAKMKKEELLVETSNEEESDDAYEQVLQEETMSAQNEENSDVEQIIEYVLEEEPEVIEEQISKESKRKLDESEIWRKIKHQLDSQKKIRLHLEKQRNVRPQSKKDNEQATVDCSNSTIGSIAQRIFEKDNEFEHFGGYIAAGLRCLTVKSCIKAQDEIQAVLSKYRLMDLETVYKNLNHEL